MNLRILVAIATFDNPGSIASVVGGLLDVMELPLLVVDDGSRRPVAGLLAEAGLTKRAGERLAVVRHPANHGKGAALQTAFAWALARGYTHVLTFDGDGQHLASQVAALTAAGEARPWSLVIGARVFPERHVPGSSRFGRAFSNFWVRYTTGVAVGDSQSGLRLYPLFYLQGRRFLTSRYDFEVEVLTRLLWSGVDVVEVPVEVHYPPAAERVSHFRKVLDNVRISWLNVGLVTWSLFRSWPTRKTLAWSLLVAPALACLPLAPWLVFLLLALATVVLRLSGWLALLCYGLGFLVPPLVAGRWGLEVRGADWPWVAAAGALLAGVIAGAPRRTQGQAWTGRSRGGWIGHRFLGLVSRWLGLGATYLCLAFITPYFYAFAPRARRASLEYFAAVYPTERWLRRRWQVLRHFYTFGTVLLDRLFQSHQAGPAFAVRLAGLPAFEAAAAGGRGVIVLTAHVGGWDLSARTLATNHLSRRSVVAEFIAGDAAGVPAAPEGARPLVQRASFHNEAAPLLAYKEALEAGGIVGMMGDRPLSGKLALVPFMGRLAAFDLTPFRLAQALGIQLVYCFAFKTGFRSYELALQVAPALSPEAGRDKDQACEAALRHFVSELERRLREHPHQWFNFYPFFSTKPVALA